MPKMRRRNIVCFKTVCVMYSIKKLRIRKLHRMNRSIPSSCNIADNLPNLHEKSIGFIEIHDIGEGGRVLLGY